MRESLIAFASDRVLAVLNTIAELQDSDFPYDQSKIALEEIKDLFSRQQQRLDQLKQSNYKDSLMVEEICQEVIKTAFNSLPLLGFIARSTSVRNAFELQGPLARLFSMVLGQPVNLVISSEWNYSPFIYFEIPDKKPHFVFVGFPASESSNPFLVPLAGHELGHALWNNKKLSKEFRKSVVQAIIEEICKTKWEEFCEEFKLPSDVDRVEYWQNPENEKKIFRPIEWAQRQTEEVFCDIIGLKLFGRAFMSAFSFLLAPGLGIRHISYPSERKRMDFLEKAVRVFGYDIKDCAPTDFTESIQLPGTLDKGGRFFLHLADAGVEAVIPQIIEIAQELIDDSNAELFRTAKVEEIINSLEMNVPTERAEGLANILNGGWEAYNKITKDALISDDDRRRKIIGLKEMIWKSIEISEIEVLTEA